MPPNIVLVVLDTLRKDHCSLYGYERETTPFLDSFAQENSYSEDVYANSCWSPPSHASLMTGRYPFQHGVTAEDTYMDVDSYLPEVLSGNGYTTLGFSNNPWISRAFGWDRGFDYFQDNSVGDEKLSRLLPLTLTNLSKALLVGLWGIKNPVKAIRSIPELGHLLPRSLGLSDGGARRTNGMVERELKETEQPFFLFINYMDIHEPHRPSPLHHPFSGIKQRFTGNRNYRDRFNPPFDIQDTIDLYDDAVHYLDRRVEELFRCLKSMDLMDDTVVIVTSDHGQVFKDEHLGHAPVMEEEILRVPFFSKGLELPESGFSLRDVYWLLLEEAGIEVDEDYPGDVLAEVYGSLRTELPDHRSQDWWKRYEAVLFQEGDTHRVSSNGGIKERDVELFPEEVVENAEKGVVQERFEIDF